MIWCVEDDPSIRDIEVYALSSTGFEARGFEDGDSFWNALQSEKPELIVLDVMLPGKDGVTLLKLMKANEAFADIPVIMTTAKGISMAAALVSMLNLETAMFAQFGAEMSQQDQNLMIILTGAGISMTIVVLSVLLIVKATKEIRSENHGT